MAPRLPPADPAPPPRPAAAAPAPPARRDASPAPTAAAGPFRAVSAGAGPARPDPGPDPAPGPAPGPASDPALATVRPARPRAPRRKAAPPPPPAPTLRLLTAVSVVTLIADQALKYVVLHVLQLDQKGAIDVAAPWLNLRMAWNQGINFGLGASDSDAMRWGLVALALAICAWVVLWLRRTRAGALAQVAGGLLVGGAIGNVIDRIAYGAVADFLNMSLPGWQNPYSFNVADIAIFAGAIGLVLLPAPRPAPAPEPPVRRPRRRGAADKGDDGAGKTG